MKDPEGWTIGYNPKPIPDRRFDWDYYHEDYDGENGLCGAAETRQACLDDIAEVEL